MKVVTSVRMVPQALRGRKTPGGQASRWLATSSTSRASAPAVTPSVSAVRPSAALPGASRDTLPPSAAEVSRSVDRPGTSRDRPTPPLDPTTPPRSHRTGPGEAGSREPRTEHSGGPASTQPEMFRPRQAPQPAWQGRPPRRPQTAASHQLPRSADLLLSSQRRGMGSPRPPPGSDLLLISPERLEKC